MIIVTGNSTNIGLCANVEPVPTTAAEAPNDDIAITMGINRAVGPVADRRTAGGASTVTSAVPGAAGSVLRQRLNT
jgi:hypothetical protein